MTPHLFIQVNSSANRGVHHSGAVLNRSGGKLPGQSVLPSFNLLIISVISKDVMGGHSGVSVRRTCLKVDLV